MAEKDKSPDSELQLKKRARRRLVGAAALALFAVIVLPMVMDREPRPISQDIQVRIPSRDTSMTIANVQPGNSVATPTSAPDPDPDPKSAPMTNLEPAKKSEPAEVPSTPGTKVAATKKTPVAASEKKNSPPVENAATTKSSTQKDDVPDQWVVQLGAYREIGNVKILLAKLKGVGVPAFTEKLDSSQGPRTRVRAGPFSSREAAEKARSKIRIIGVDGPVAQK